MQVINASTVALHYTGLEMRFLDLCGFPDAMTSTTVKDGPKVLKKEGIRIEDVDLFEINEAFAGSTVTVIRELGIDMDKVNVNGGAIALGHPIGASGARVLTTLIYEMIRQDKKTGLASLCLGGGEAVALIIRRDA